ncbi:hypothetical protein PG999_002903 [Apiospora kogelbergensis]|uniref:2EXR domain-containing protein n=1 Tax=Apiospora kogelbergensis TaxID=1337665 RepID=A0AAW0R9Q0_9PEZI
MESTSGGRRLHFNMPPGLESFPLFVKLPYDIRYRIWRELIYVPGIHFLKFEPTRNQPTRAISDQDSERDDDDDATAPLNPRRRPRHRPKRDTRSLYSANLTPIYPLPAADLSYYITANKNMTMLMLSCEEAADLATKATNKPGKLELDNKRLISLADSEDVICIDYPDLNRPTNLGSWASNLNQTQLDAVRYLAVRYHPYWDDTRRRCPYCGIVHQLSKMPLHRNLYEFVALFKNLERFYFIDYHTIKYSSAITTALQIPSPMQPFQAPRWCRPHQDLIQNAGGRKFLSGGRTYYELSPKDWQLNSNVFMRLSWVRSEYLKYCNKHSETTHKDPTTVKFWVLGCEYDSKLQKHRQNDERPAKSRHLRRQAKSQADIDTMMKRLSLNKGKGDGEKGGRMEFNQPAGLPVRFGGGKDATYEFQFSAN